MNLSLKMGIEMNMVDSNNSAVKCINFATLT